MGRVDIGVNVDDLRLGTKRGLQKASDLGFRTVELATVHGDLAPAALSTSARRHLLRYVDGCGLRLVALVADMPGLRLTDPQTVGERVDSTCRVVELAADLQVPTVTASVGALTHPETGDPSPTATEALARIGEYADTRGVVYAIRPTSDTGDRLGGVLAAVGCPSLGVCLDPAALVMAGANPMAEVERLVRQIRFFHARDATAGYADRPGRETRLGEGDVDLTGVVALLDAIDYRGPYVLRRHDAADLAADLQAGRDYLVRLLPPSSS